MISRYVISVNGGMCAYSLAEIPQCGLVVFDFSMFTAVFRLVEWHDRITFRNVSLVGAFHHPSYMKMLFPEIPIESWLADNIRDEVTLIDPMSEVVFRLKYSLPNK